MQSFLLGYLSRIKARHAKLSVNQLFIKLYLHKQFLQVDSLLNLCFYLNEIKLSKCRWFCCSDKKMIERFSSSYSNFKLKNECVQTLARLITLNNVFLFVLVEMLLIMEILLDELHKIRSRWF
jgi:hypothetical protein